MALARVKTWNPGDTLTAADLNAEFNNILNNPISLVSPTTGAINFQTSVAHTNLTPAALTGSSGASGNVLTLSTAATPSPIWASLPGISLVRGLNGLVSTLSTGTFQADSYLLQTTAVPPALFSLNSTAAFNVATTLAGPIVGGRDVSAAFSSTFLHLYAITTGPGSTTPAGILSSTPPPAGPAMPSTTGYVAWCYLGTFQYSSASTTFANNQVARGGWMHYNSRQNVLSSGTATTETAISLSSAVPINALSIQFDSYLFGPNNATISGPLTAEFRTLAGAQFTQVSQVRTTVNSGNTIGNKAFLANQTSSQQILYLITTDPAGGTAGSISLWVTGYQVANGGN